MTSSSMASTARSASIGWRVPAAISASARWTATSLAMRRVQNPLVRSVPVKFQHDPSRSASARAATVSSSTAAKRSNADVVVGEAHEAVVAGRGVEALPHEDGGALEHLAGVADQAADGPARAGGDGGVEPGGAGRVEQGEAVTVQVGDVIHRRVLHRVGGGRLSTRGGAGTRCAVGRA